MAEALHISLQQAIDQAKAAEEQLAGYGKKVDATLNWNKEKGEFDLFSIKISNIRKLEKEQMDSQKRIHREELKSVSNIHNQKLSLENQYTKDVEKLHDRLNRSLANMAGRTANALWRSTVQMIETGASLAGGGIVGGLYMAANQQKEVGSAAFTSKIALQSSTPVEGFINTIKTSAITSGSTLAESAQGMRAFAQSGAKERDLSAFPQILTLAKMYGVGTDSLGKSFGSLREQFANSSTEELMAMLNAQAISSSQSRLEFGDYARNMPLLVNEIQAQKPNASPWQVHDVANRLYTVGAKSGMDPARVRSAINKTDLRLDKIGAGLGLTTSQSSDMDIIQMLDMAVDRIFKKGTMDTNEAKRLGFTTDPQRSLLSALENFKRTQPGEYATYLAPGMSQEDVTTKATKDAAEYNQQPFVKTAQLVEKLSQTISDAFTPALENLVKTAADPQFIEKVKELANSLQQAVPQLVEFSKTLIDFTNNLLGNSFVKNLLPYAIADKALGSPVANTAEFAIGALVAEAVKQGLILGVPAFGAALGAPFALAAGPIIAVVIAGVVAAALAYKAADAIPQDFWNDLFDDDQQRRFKHPEYYNVDESLNNGAPKTKDFFTDMLDATIGADAPAFKQYKSWRGSEIPGDDLVRKIYKAGGNAENIDLRNMFQQPQPKTIVEKMTNEGSPNQSTVSNEPPNFSGAFFPNATIVIPSMPK